MLGRQAGGVPAAVHSVAGADRRWLLLAAAAGGASYVAAAVAQLGGLERATRAALPGGPRGWWGRLVVVQLACACTNRLLPAGAGAMATNVRHLTRRGLTARQAGAAVATTAAAGVVMHLLTLLAAVPVLLALPAVHDLVVQHAPGRAVGLWAVGGALAVAGLLARPFPALRGPVTAARTALRHLASALRDRHRAAALLGGSLGVTSAHAVAFLAALRAVASPTPVLVALAVYVAAVTVAGCVPTPGGARRGRRRPARGLGRDRRPRRVRGSSRAGLPAGHLLATRAARRRRAALAAPPAVAVTQPPARPGRAAADCRVPG